MKITIIKKKIKPRMNELHHSHFLFGCRNQKISSSTVQSTQEKDDSMLFFFFASLENNPPRRPASKRSQWHGG